MAGYCQRHLQNERYLPFSQLPFAADSSCQSLFSKKKRCSMARCSSKAKEQGQVIVPSRVPVAHIFFRRGRRRIHKYSLVTSASPARCRAPGANKDYQLHCPAAVCRRRPTVSGLRSFAGSRGPSLLKIKRNYIFQHKLCWRLPVVRASAKSRTRSIHSPRWTGAGRASRGALPSTVASR